MIQLIRRAAQIHLPRLLVVRETEHDTAGSRHVLPYRLCGPMLVYNAVGIVVSSYQNVFPYVLQLGASCGLGGCVACETEESGRRKAIFRALWIGIRNVRVPKALLKDEIG